MERFFEQPELARRYHAHRPRVHDQVIRGLLASRPTRARDAALDVACGTGHSTLALTMAGGAVYGCDPSSAMLSLARRERSSSRFVRCQAEELPFSARSFDLVTVALAFHWFDQRRFLEETGRVLAANGELWVYDLVFPGVLLGDERFFAWHREEYLSRYPVPARRTGTVASRLNSWPSPLAFVEQRKLEYEVTFTARELRNYLTTQSNIEAALHRGESLRDVDAWLDRELSAFFGGRRSQRFAYWGRAEIAAAAS